MVICLERGADLHMVQLMPLPLTVSCFSKVQIVLPFWYRLTRVVPEKGPLNGCVCMCLFIRVDLIFGRLGLGLEVRLRLLYMLVAGNNTVVEMCSQLSTL